MAFTAPIFMKLTVTQISVDNSFTQFYLNRTKNGEGM
jgi:hypothetical protein